MSIESSDFFRKIEEYAEYMGHGDLTGSVEVNQHYALDQHENFNYEHPRGGGPKYLINPLLEHYVLYLTYLEAAVDTGAPLWSAMAAAMEHLSGQLDPAAPIDEDPNPIRLRRSGHPTVTDNGRVVYDRPPEDPREPFIVGRDGKSEDEEYDQFGFRTGQSY